MLSVTHIMPVLVLNICMDANMQFTISSFRQLFPDNILSPTLPWFSVKSLTFPWQLSNSLTFPGFQDKWSPWLQGIVKHNQNTVNLMFWPLLEAFIRRSSYYTVSQKNGTCIILIILYSCKSIAMKFSMSYPNMCVICHLTLVMFLHYRTLHKNRKVIATCSQ